MLAPSARERSRRYRTDAESDVRKPAAEAAQYDRTVHDMIAATDVVSSSVNAVPKSRLRSSGGGTSGHANANREEELAAARRALLRSTMPSLSSTTIQDGHASAMTTTRSIRALLGSPLDRSNSVTEPSITAAAAANADGTSGSSSGVSSSIDRNTDVNAVRAALRALRYDTTIAQQTEQPAFRSTTNPRAIAKDSSVVPRPLPAARYFLRPQPQSPHAARQQEEEDTDEETAGLQGRQQDPQEAQLRPSAAALDTGSRGRSVSLLVDTFLRGPPPPPNGDEDAPLPPSVRRAVSSGRGPAGHKDDDFIRGDSAGWGWADPSPAPARPAASEAVAPQVPRGGWGSPFTGVERAPAWRSDTPHAIATMGMAGGMDDFPIVLEDIGTPPPPPPPAARTATPASLDAAADKKVVPRTHQQAQPIGRAASSRTGGETLCSVNPVPVSSPRHLRGPDPLLVRAAWGAPRFAAPTASSSGRTAQGSTSSVRGSSQARRARGALAVAYKVEPYELATAKPSRHAAAPLPSLASVPQVEASPAAAASPPTPPPAAATAEPTALFEADGAVAQQLARVIRACRAHGRTCPFCGDPSVPFLFWDDEKGGQSAGVADGEATAGGSVTMISQGIPEFPMRNSHVARCLSRRREFERRTPVAAGPTGAPGVYVRARRPPANSATSQLSAGGSSSSSFTFVPVAFIDDGFVSAAAQLAAVVDEIFTQMALADAAQRRSLMPSSLNATPGASRSASSGTATRCHGLPSGAAFARLAEDQAAFEAQERAAAEGETLAARNAAADAAAAELAWYLAWPCPMGDDCADRCRRYDAQDAAGRIRGPSIASSNSSALMMSSYSATCTASTSATYSQSSSGGGGSGGGRISHTELAQHVARCWRVALHFRYFPAADAQWGKQHGDDEGFGAVLERDATIAARGPSISAALAAPSSWRFEAVPRGPSMPLAALLLRAAPARALASAAVVVEAPTAEGQAAPGLNPCSQATELQLVGSHGLQPRRDEATMMAALESCVVVVRSCDDAVVGRTSSTSIGALWACDFDVFC